MSVGGPALGRGGITSLELPVLGSPDLELKVSEVRLDNEPDEHADIPPGRSARVDAGAAAAFEVDITSSQAVEGVDARVEAVQALSEMQGGAPSILAASRNLSSLRVSTSAVKSSTEVKSACRSAGLTIQASRGSSGAAETDEIFLTMLTVEVEVLRALLASEDDVWIFFLPLFVFKLPFCFHFLS